ncbi:MAG TPA: hypothetical protein VFI42_05690 [Thermomicrobiaceae bacterium]|nr:hypothetical protein [Thermomicrobiaceae bacterium]
MVLSRFIQKIFETEESGTASINDDGPRPNHHLIYREIKEFADRQNRQMDSLDTKGGLVAATSTALTAGFVALFNSVATSSTTAFRTSIIPVIGMKASNQTLLYILLGVAFISYIIVLFGLFKAVRDREWEIVPDPATLLDQYWEKTANETMADLCATMARAARDNQPRLDDKIRWIGRSFVLLGVEVLVLFLAIMVGVWSGLL